MILLKLLALWCAASGALFGLWVALCVGVRKLDAYRAQRARVIHLDFQKRERLP